MEIAAKYMLIGLFSPRGETDKKPYQFLTIDLCFDVEWSMTALISLQEILSEDEKVAKYGVGG